MMSKNKLKIIPSKKKNCNIIKFIIKFQNNKEDQKLIYDRRILDQKDRQF